MAQNHREAQGCLTIILWAAIGMILVLAVLLAGSIVGDLFNYGVSQ